MLKEFNDFIDGRYLRKADKITMSLNGKTYTDSPTYIKHYAIQIMRKEGL